MEFDVICIKCQRKMKVKKVGVHVVEFTEWKMTVPYKFFEADLFECPICHFETISRFGSPTHASELSKGVIDELVAAANYKFF